MAEVHDTALVDPGARLGEGVLVGPYAVIGGDVEIGDGTLIGPHAVIHRYTRIGRQNRIHAHTVLGDLPQDVTFEGGESWLEIGDRNRIRENVTIHRASRPDRLTRIGCDCFLMAGSHVAHDCALGDRVVLTNNVLLAGVVEVGDGAVFGGGAAVHQFTRIGPLAMIAGFAGVPRDILPYTMAHGLRARHYRLNTVGLRRAGVRGDRYRALETAIRAVRRGDKTLAAAPDTPEIELLREWLAAPSKRGLSGWAAKKD